MPTFLRLLERHLKAFSRQSSLRYFFDVASISGGASASAFIDATMRQFSFLPCLSSCFVFLFLFFCELVLWRIYARPSALPFSFFLFGFVYIFIFIFFVVIVLELQEPPASPFIDC